MRWPWRKSGYVKAEARPSAKAVEVRWTDSASLAVRADAITGACSICGAPCRIPEDVFAQVEERATGKVTNIIVCEECVASPDGEERTIQAMSRALANNERRRNG